MKNNEEKGFYRKKNPEKESANNAREDVIYKKLFIAKK